jgi:hypothetical protein
LDLRDLAAVYLGGVTVMGLAAVGRIEELAPGAGSLGVHVACRPGAF